MNLLQLAALKDKSLREARKWVAYLETVKTTDEKEKTLARKFEETWLEGRQFVDDGRLSKSHEDKTG